MLASKSAVPRLLLLTATLSLALNGCAGLRLYDASKDNLAEDTQKQLNNAKVTETVDISLANSKAFLTEAERVADLEAQVRKKRAQLVIAESSTSTAQWLEALWKEQGDLGFKNTRAAHLRLQADVAIEDAIKKAAKNRVRVKDFASDPVVKELVTGPLCEGITKESSVPTTTELDAFEEETLAADFEAYQRTCLALAKTRAERLGQVEGATANSALDRAQQERASAAANRDFLQERIVEAKKELATAQTELKAAQKAAEGDKSGLANLKKKAGKVAKAAEKVAELAEKAGFEDLPLDNIKNLAVLLNAVSTGEVDKAAVGEEGSPLAKAALAAAELPSLAEDAIALLAAGKAPPTNHLILALNYQQILYNRALALSNLWIEELALHDKKIAAIHEQARQYRELQYRLCNYAVRKAGKPRQGVACVAVTFESGGQTCKIGPRPDKPGQAPLVIENCALGKSWRDNYKGSNEPRAKRQLLAALLAHSRAHDARSAVRKIDFQIIDVGHRRIAESNRAAIAAWNNLVTVPVDSLAAYHKAGIKPESVAGAAAQLLGLLGIGVGIGVSD